MRAAHVRAADAGVAVPAAGEDQGGGARQHGYQRRRHPRPRRHLILHPHPRRRHHGRARIHRLATSLAVIIDGQLRLGAQEGKKRLRARDFHVGSIHLRS